MEVVYERRNDVSNREEMEFVVPVDKVNEAIENVKQSCRYR